jgi:hypothetical protein
MISLNKKQFDSLIKKLIEKFPLVGFVFNEPYEKTENNITYQVIERYNHQMKIIYVIVSLKIDGQFDRLKELEIIAKSICVDKDANFGFYSTCNFDNDDANYLAHDSTYQIERKK